jgi:hypothetical protein
LDGLLELTARLKKKMYCLRNFDAFVIVYYTNLLPICLQFIQQNHTKFLANLFHGKRLTSIRSSFEMLSPEPAWSCLQFNTDYVKWKIIHIVTHIISWMAMAAIIHHLFYQCSSETFRIVLYSTTISLLLPLYFIIWTEDNFLYGLLKVSIESMGFHILGMLFVGTVIGTIALFGLFFWYYCAALLGRPCIYLSRWKDDEQEEPKKETLLKRDVIKKTKRNAKMPYN